MSAAAKKKKKKTMKTRDFILACLLVRIGWIYIYIYTHIVNLHFTDIGKN